MMPSAGWAWPCCVLVGLGLLVPSLGHLIERPFYRFPQRAVGTGRNGFLLGIALGAVFVPCAGPVLAAITVAGATGHIGLHTVGLTLGFAVGTAIPLLAFALAGRGLTQRLGAFRRHQGAFRAVSGVVIIVLAVALTFNLSDIVQRDIPNYTQAVGNSVEKGAAQKLRAAAAACLCRIARRRPNTAAPGWKSAARRPAFSGIQRWLNTPGGQPLTLASVKGKVVIVDFWAYSCINCQRELPHVEAWAKNYAADGLEVVGVHTPEYAFEHVPSNVAAGARRLGLTFPIALDNSYATWNAYDNQSWPAAYIIDAGGQIRHVSIGEGDYSSEEQLIRQLLVAAHPGPDPAGGDRCPRHHPRQSGADTGDLPRRRTRSRLYDGSASYSDGQRQFVPIASPRTDSFTLSGTWTIADESITAGAGAGITLGYNASDVYLDVGGTGTLTVSSGGTTKVIPVSGAPDIYTVVSQPSPRDATVTIRLSPGLQAYSFTYG